MQIKVLRIPCGVYQANCYLVYDQKTLEGFIVDPGGDAPYLKTVIEENHVKPTAILLTHGHGDHIGAVNALKEEYNIPVYAHEMEDLLLKDTSINLSDSMVMGAYTVDADTLFKDGDMLPVLSGVKVIHTPGHTAGSVCFGIDDHLITGDTLFVSSIGRTDLATADPQAMEESLDKIKTLSPNYTIYPGHGPSNTLAREFQSNPFLR